MLVCGAVFASQHHVCKPVVSVEWCHVRSGVFIQLKFLEVSHLSFVAGLGPKLKEGMVEKRAGGRRVALHCCMCCTCCQPGRWQKR